MLTIRHLAAAALALSACQSAGSAEADAEGAVAINVGALSLPDLVDVCYGLAVSSGSAAGPVVWSRGGVCADAFGDGGSAVSFVGPCDASAGTNVVSLTLEGLYRSDGAGGKVAIPTSDYANPCPASSPCAKAAACAPNADTAITFDLTVARDAGQGFFDVAVEFDDLFCSAKFDCEGSGGGPLELLFDATSARAATAVLALGCSGGDGADTHLYLSDLAIACANAPGVTVDPAAGAGGNVYATARPVGQGLIYQYAVYEGRESLGTTNVASWNVALGVDETFLASAGLCTLTATATASDGPLTDAATPPGASYPLLTWDVALNPSGGGTLGCGAQRLDDPASGVGVDYTTLEGVTCFENALTTDWQVPGAPVSTDDVVPSGVCKTEVSFLEEFTAGGAVNGRLVGDFAWSTGEAQWNIDANNGWLRLDSGVSVGSPYPSATVDTGASDGVLVAVLPFGNYSHAGVVFRAAGPNNHLFCGYRGNGNGWVIAKMAGVSPTVLADGSGGEITSTQVVTVTMVGDQVHCRVTNATGSFVYADLTATAADNQTETSHGVGTYTRLVAANYNRVTSVSFTSVVPGP